MTTEATPGAADSKATPPADEGKKAGEAAPADAGKAADSKPDAKAASLFATDGDGAAAAEGEKKPEDKKDEQPLDGNDPNAYLLAEGVMGKGAAPEWFKKDKYKSVEDQAKAYTDLEKRFGSFVGAPKDGKYETPKMPEGVEGEFLVDHPMFGKFGEWAAKAQLSQAGYNDLLGMLAQYEASQVPDLAAIKQALGADADKRIGAVTGWAKANLTAEQLAVFRDVGSTAAAGQVLQLMEAVIAKAQQAKTPPKVGDDTAAAASADPLANIRKLHGELLPNGKLRYNEDAKHRAAVDKAYQDHFAKQK